MSNARELAELGGAYSTGGYPHFKNRIINGAMMIDQRNAGASFTPTTNGQYTLDRWAALLTTSSKYTVQQNAGSVTPPNGFSKYLGVTVGASANVTVGLGDLFGLTQSIEGFNFADLQWGTSSAQTITLSANVYSSVTGTFGGSLRNSATNRSYPFTYTISAANTWTQISVTIAGDTSGTWIGATNGIGVQVIFGLGVGTTLSGTAGAWAGANYYSATGAVKPIETNSATFYITGVQLEKGSTATSFDYRPYGTELALCQRYYEVGYVASGAPATQYEPTVRAFQFTVQKRATPTCAELSLIANASSATFAFAGINTNGAYVYYFPVANFSLRAVTASVSAEL